MISQSSPIDEFTAMIGKTQSLAELPMKVTYFNGDYSPPGKIFLEIRFHLVRFH
jgi:hypothetical protein